MSCHGPTYLTIYRSWKAGLDERLEGLKKEVDRVGQSAGGQGEPSSPLHDARANLALLERGHAIHNPPYALGIAERVAADLATIAEQAGGEAPRAPLWRQAPYQIECLKCHFGVELIGGSAFGREFSHLPHTVEARLRCTVCHGDLQRHGSLKLDAESCEACHQRIRAPMVVTENDECLACHVADIGRVSSAVKFPHAGHIEMGLSCDTCHEGVGEKPHLDFARAHRAHPKLGHEFCATCHADDVPSKDGDVPDDAKCGRCHEDF